MQFQQSVSLFSRIVNTPYEVVMGEDISCRLLCHDRSNLITWNEFSSQQVIDMIEHEYSVHLLGYFHHYQSIAILFYALFIPNFSFTD